MNHTLKERQIIFFDGVCGLCDRFVDFVIKYDSKKRFYFAPLQGKTAKEFKVGLETSNSVLLWRGGNLTSKSTAAIQILSQLNWWLWPVRILLLIPVFLRNPVYDFIAKKRYQWFGRKEHCRIPTKEERSFFLD